MSINAKATGLNDKPVGLDPVEVLRMKLKRIAPTEDGKSAFIASFTTEMPVNEGDILSKWRRPDQVDIAFTCSCDPKSEVGITSYDSHLLSITHKKYVEVCVGRYGAI